MVMVVSGCVESADDGSPTIKVIRDSAQADEVVDEPDLCAIASELSSDDVCSLMCDPEAMAQFLVAGGTSAGKCVQLRCELPGVDPVLVGVCLPP